MFSGIKYVLYILSIHATLLPLYIVCSHEKKPLEGEIRYHVSEILFHHVKLPLIISIWILLVSIAKIGFHKCKGLSGNVPESCMLIFLGIVVGLSVYYTKVAKPDEYALSTSAFFLTLLPPIVLEAGYFMPRRAFFDNLGLILFLAIFGTIFNSFFIGISLYVVSRMGFFGVQIGMIHCLLFSSLISAVDPVAILAVFEEIHVNDVLHIVVFGESLLNDGVALVLYNMFNVYSEMGIENIKAIDLFAGFASFFVVAGFGTLIGVLFAIIAALLTKHTNRVKIIEPIIVCGLAYLSYLLADMFKLSGLLAIVFCGLIMRKYIEANISNDSKTSLKYGLKMMSNMSESIIFLFLGLSTVVNYHIWNTSFIAFTLFFCILYRIIGSVCIVELANRKRTEKIDKVEIFTICYSGLRGAISFSLALLLEEDHVGGYNKRMFVTTAIAVVMFTSFFQGITIKPLVEILKVRKSEERETTMVAILFSKCFDHITLFADDLIGHKGHNRCREIFSSFENKFFKPYLMKEKPKTKEMKMFEACNSLNVKDINQHIQEKGWNMAILDRIPQSERKESDAVVYVKYPESMEEENEVNESYHSLMRSIIKTPVPRYPRYSKNMIYHDDQVCSDERRRFTFGSIGAKSSVQDCQGVKIKSDHESSIVSKSPSASFKQSKEIENILCSVTSQSPIEKQGMKKVKFLESTSSASTSRKMPTFSSDY